jgi:hypothetical protein
MVGNPGSLSSQAVCLPCNGFRFGPMIPVLPLPLSVLR